MNWPDHNGSILQFRALLKTRHGAMGNIDSTASFPTLQPMAAPASRHIASWVHHCLDLPAPILFRHATSSCFPLIRQLSEHDVGQFSWV
jgi:hypothetical protein